MTLGAIFSPSKCWLVLRDCFDCLPFTLDGIALPFQKFTFRARQKKIELCFPHVEQKLIVDKPFIAATEVFAKLLISFY